MKDQKYMIGNLATSIKFGKPVRLTLQDFADANHYADGSDSLEWFKHNLIPIEVTVNNLIDHLGFKKESHCARTPMLQGLELCYNFFEGVVRLQTTQGGFTIPLPELKYIHQVQNYYESMNGTELKPRVITPKTEEAQPKRLTGLSHDKSLTTDGEFIYSHELKFAQIKLISFTDLIMVVYFKNIESGESGDMQFSNKEHPELSQLLFTKHIAV
jgi:hypothetical protein